MENTALITGGAGFIGSHVVDRFVDLGYRVVVIDDFSTGKEENLAHHSGNERVIIKRMSITEPMDEVFSVYKPSVVVHLAAMARVPLSIAEPQKTNDVNVNGTLNLLVAAQKHGTKRFVNYGSSSEYGDPPTRPFVEDMVLVPLSPYGLQKMAADHYARLFHVIHGMETVTIRPFNVFGPRMNYEGAYALLIAKVHQWLFTGSEFQINGDGNQTRDFTYVDDVVAATMQAATTQNKACFGEAFNVGAADPQVINDVVNRIIAFSGKSIEAQHGPALIEPRNTLASIEKGKQLLDWSPKATFDEALRETFEYFKKHFKVM